MDTQKFEFWCIVELFGHAKIAGFCSEQTVAGASMLRVDVPETTEQPAFTRLFNASAIYSINPVDETTAKATAERIQIKPIEAWNISEVMKKANEKLLISSASNIEDTNEGNDIDEWDHD